LFPPITAILKTTMTDSLTIALAQLNPTVGDVGANTDLEIGRAHV